MLEAYVSHKARTATAAKLNEDEITSIVFGPLKFMMPSECLLVVKECGLVDLATMKGSEPPTQHYVEFWRKFPIPLSLRKEGRSFSEPDVFFRFEFEDATELWLILEIKWDA